VIFDVKRERLHYNEMLTIFTQPPILGRRSLTNGSSYYGPWDQKV